MRNRFFLLMILAVVAVALPSCKTPAGDKSPSFPQGALIVPSKPEPVTKEPEGELVQKKAQDAPETDVISKEPDVIRPDADNLYNAALSLFNTGHYRDAVGAFKETLEMDPGHTRAHYDLALSYLMADDRDSALGEYKALLELEPGMADSLRKEAVEIVTSDSAYKLILQVGAFRVSDNAKKLLNELKKEYMFVYMEHSGVLYKVLIHGMKTIEEGSRLMQEIKEKYNIHPFLIIQE